MSSSTKIKKLQKWMQENKTQVSIFFNIDMRGLDANFFYLSKYTGLGFLVIPAKKPAFLVVPTMEKEKAKQQSNVRVVSAKKSLILLVKKELKKNRIRVQTAGIDKNKISLNAFSRLKKEVKAKYVDISLILAQLRVAKTPNEIKIIQKACKLTDDIFNKTFMNFKKFKTESEVAAFMTNETLKLGCEVSFKPIVASGKSAASPHYEPANSKLKKGFCVIDFGIIYNGYCSDMTRTIYLGKPKYKEVELYYLLLKTQLDCINHCKAGVNFLDIQKLAMQKLGKYSKYFIHSIGHGLGIDVHESLAPKKTKIKPLSILKEGSIITIEPGIYISNKLGMRIEDDILITKNKPKILTKTGKNLLIINI